MRHEMERLVLDVSGDADDDAESLTQAMKIDMVNTITKVDEGLPIVGDQLELPQPADFKLSGEDVLADNQYIFVKNGRVMRYARYGPTFQGVMALSGQRPVDFLNAKFADFLGQAQRVNAIEFKQSIDAFIQNKARDALQRAALAYQLETVIKYSVFQQKIKDSTRKVVGGESSSAQTSSVCRYSFDDQARLMSTWRMDEPSEYISKILPNNESSSAASMSYNQYIQDSKLNDLLRDMIYQLVWKIASRQLQYELQEHKIAFLATDIMLKDRPNLDGLSSSGASTYHGNVKKFYSGAGPSVSVADGGDAQEAAADATPPVPTELADAAYAAAGTCANVTPSVYEDNKSVFPLSSQ